MEAMPATWITWRDALLMPEDGNRYEAIGGELYVTAAPSFRHQRISFRLSLALYRLLEEPGLGLLCPAPVGVEIPGTEEGLQPDLVFVSSERLHIIGDDWIRGAPDLVVEILSPSTSERDRGLKRKLYQRHGVKEYWIVDPEAERVEVWNFAGGAAEPQIFSARLPVRFGGALEGEIDLREIFLSERRD